MRFTRREWAILFGTAPLAADASASQATPQQPAPVAEPSLAKSISDVRKASDRLAKLEVPMNVEPAFMFKA